MLIWLELATYMENLIKNYSLCLNAQKGGKEERRRRRGTWKGVDGIERAVEATDGEAAETLGTTGHGPQAGIYISVWHHRRHLSTLSSIQFNSSKSHTQIRTYMRLILWSSQYSHVTFYSFDNKI